MHLIISLRINHAANRAMLQKNSSPAPGTLLHKMKIVIKDAYIKSYGNLEEYGFVWI